MAAQDWWLSEADALNIVRCKHREPDDVLRKMLRGAAGLLGIKTKELGDGTSKIVEVPEPPSGGWPIRWKFQSSAYGFNVPFFFSPDLEKWLDSIDKPAAKPATHVYPETDGALARSD